MLFQSLINRATNPITKLYNPSTFHHVLQQVNYQDKTVRHMYTVLYNNVHTLHVRRSLLYMPGSSDKMLSKIVDGKLQHADSICMDLEDAVSHNKKQDARELIVNTIHKLRNNPTHGRSELCVRLNGIESVYNNDDIKYILYNNKDNANNLPDTIVIPKLETPEQLRYISNELDKIDSQLDNKINIMALIETSRGLVNIQHICNLYNTRLNAFIFGGDDYAADIGATRSKDSIELLTARQTIVMYCKAYKLQAIDIVHIDLNNNESLENECIFGNNIGYTGKQLIHPKQIDITNQCYSPSKQRIDWAINIVQHANQHSNSGKGAFELDGQMIDMPTIKAAQNTINIAKQCGLI